MSQHVQVNFLMKIKISPVMSRMVWNLILIFTKCITHAPRNININLVIMKVRVQNSSWNCKFFFTKEEAHTDTRMIMKCKSIININFSRCLLLCVFIRPLNWFRFPLQEESERERELWRERKYALSCVRTTYSERKKSAISLSASCFTTLDLSHTPNIPQFVLSRKNIYNRKFLHNNFKQKINKT